MVPTRSLARDWRVYAAAGVVAGVLLAHPAFSDVVRGNDSNSAASDQQNAASGHGPAPPVIATTQTPRSDSAPQSDYQADSQNPPTPKDDGGFWNGKATDVAIVLLTLGLFVVGVIQARIYRNQARLMLAALKATSRSNRVAAKGASAALLQAQTATAVDLPIVFLSGLMLLQPIPLVGEDTQEPVDEPAPIWSRPRFSFTNHGRTPAVVTELRWGQAICFDLPEGLPTTISEWLPTGTVIEPDGGVFIYSETTHISQVPDERSAILAGERRIWVFGEIKFRDFLGASHMHRFCGAWWCPDPGDTSDRAAGFAEGGPESYHRSN